MDPIDVEEVNIEIEDFKRINRWLSVRVNPKDNQSIFDFVEYYEGEYHTLSDANELYNKFKKLKQ